MSLSDKPEEVLDTLELEIEASPPVEYALFDEVSKRVQPEAPLSPPDRRPGGKLRSFAGLLRRRRTVFIIVFLAIISVVAVYCLYRPSIFRSEAAVEVKDRLNTQGKASRVSTPGGSQVKGDTVATEVGVLRGRGIAQSLVDRLSPQAAAELKGDYRSTWGALLHGPLRPVASLWGEDDAALPKKATRSKLVDLIKERLSVHQEPGGKLIKIAFEAGSPVVAQKVLGSYIDIYLERNARSPQRPAVQTSDVLKELTRKEQERLSQSRAALKEFEGKHDVKALDKSPAEHVQRVTAVLSNLLENVDRAPQTESHAADTSPKTVSPEERERLRSLRNQLSALQARYIKISDLYAETFPPVESMRKQIDLLKKKIAEAEGGPVRTVGQGRPSASPSGLGPLAAEVEATVKRLLADQELITRYALLKQDVKIHEDLYTRLAQDAATAEPVKYGSQAGVVLVEKPSLSTAPVGTSSLLILLMGACFALIGGAFAAVLADRLDGRIYTIEDIDASLGINVLGTVPDVGKLKKLHVGKGEARPYEFLAGEMPGTPVSEAIKNVKTSLGLSNPDFPIGSLVVSSAAEGEGKTFLAVSLAAVVSSTDRRILLVDSDLRHPRIASLHGLNEGGPGLTTLITKEDVKLPDVLHRSKIPGLFHIAAGPLPPDPVTLMESDRFQEVLRRFRRMFDLVIFDSPPLIGYPDARILAANTDGLVLAIQHGRLPSRVIGQALSAVTLAGGNVLGAVLTRGDAVASYYGKTVFDYKDYYEGGKKAGPDKRDVGRQLD